MDKKVTLSIEYRGVAVRRDCKGVLFATFGDDGLNNHLMGSLTPVEIGYLLTGAVRAARDCLMRDAPVKTVPNSILVSAFLTGAGVKLDEGDTELANLLIDAMESE